MNGENHILTITRDISKWKKVEADKKKLEAQLQRAHKVENIRYQKAIIASGFSETGRVKEAQRLGAGAYAKKPYTIENIGQALMAELGR